MKYLIIMLLFSSFLNLYCTSPASVNYKFYAFLTLLSVWLSTSYSFIFFDDKKPSSFIKNDIIFLLTQAALNFTNLLWLYYIFGFRFLKRTELLDLIYIEAFIISIFVFYYKTDKKPLLAQYFVSFLLAIRIILLTFGMTLCFSFVAPFEYLKKIYKEFE